MSTQNPSAERRSPDGGPLDALDPRDAELIRAAAHVARTRCRSEEHTTAAGRGRNGRVLVGAGDRVRAVPVVDLPPESRVRADHRLSAE